MTIKTDFELRHALRALRQERPPASDLWPAIEARVTTLPRRHRGGSGRLSGKGRWLEWAAALAAAVLLTVGWFAMPRQDIPPIGSQALQQYDRADDPAQALLDAYAVILAAEQTRGVQWTTQLTVPGGADRMAAARELDASLTQLAAALRIEPRSQLLRRLMHQTLQQRAALTLDALNA